MGSCLLIIVGFGFWLFLHDVIRRIMSVCISCKFWMVLLTESRSEKRPESTKVLDNDLMGDDVDYTENENSYQT